VTVSGTPSQGEVHRHARELVELARQHGFRREELLALVADLA
jgi:hypothetical protein